MIYRIYSIPNEVRGTEYLNLLYRSIERSSDAEATFVLRKFSWKELIFKHSKNERRIIHVHWETNIYGSEYALVSIARMLYRFPGLMLAKLRGARIFWTIHNIRAHDYPHPWIDSLGRSIMWRIADAVHMQQKAYADEQMKLHAGKKTFYIPHANFVGIFGPVWTGDRDKLRAEFGISHKTIALLSFGSVRPYKELPKLIDAVSEARQKGVDVVLIIAGKASEEYLPVIEEKAKDSKGIIAHLRYIPNEDIPKYMAVSDYNALYYAESSLTSASLLLSLSYGVPVIIRDMPAAEIVRDGENGFVFHGHDELVSILEKLPNVRLQRGDAIIRTSGPDWAAMAQILRKAYLSLWI